MQSSPPVRAWHRPASPTDSQSSLDLGDLDAESHNATSPILSHRQVDPVRSEDIDGPSDFTENMAAWMRGDLALKGTAGSARSALQSFQVQHPQHQQRMNGAYGESGRLEVPQSPVLDDDHTMSHHTPDHSPPKDSPWHEQGPFPPKHHARDEQHRGDAEKAPSTWDPYAPSGTPQPPVPRHLLQPSVEEYHSDLTPARLPLRPGNAPPLRVAAQSPARHGSPSPRHSEDGTPGRPSSETLSPTRSPTRSPERSPIVQRSRNGQVSSPPATVPDSPQQELERQMQHLHARCRQLDRLNGALKQALDEEQRIRKQEKAAYQRQVDEGHNRENDLRQDATWAVNRMAELKADVEAREGQVRRLEDNAQEQQHESERTQAGYQSQITKLTERLESQRQEHATALQQLRQDLELAERSRDNADEAAKLHQEELQAFRNAHSPGSDDHRLQLDRAAERIAELEAQLGASRAEAEELRAAKSCAADDVQTARRDAEALRREHEAERARLTSDRNRQQAESQTRQQQITLLQQQLRDEQVAHDHEIERLETAHEAALAGASATVNAARKDVEAQQSLRNEATIDRDAAQDSLKRAAAELAEARAESATLRAELEKAQDELGVAQKQAAAAHSDAQSLREALEASDSVNAALDAKIAEALRKREAYWRRRLQESEDERAAMAKALLHQWGREEVGVEDPQAFAYRFAGAGRNGAGKVGSRRT